MKDIRAFQLFDSALPIGGFHYSNTVEEARYVVEDMAEYISSFYRNVILPGDVVAARLAFGDPWDADALLFASKVTTELRDMTVGKGRSLVELDLAPGVFFGDVKSRKTPGTYPVVVAQLAKALEVSEALCLYGVAHSEVSAMVLAAVRMRALDFLEAQRLLGRLLSEFSVPDEFSPFDPFADILSKRHEKREPKVFLS